MAITPEIYIAISVVVLAVIAILVIYTMKKRKKRKQPSKLATLGMTLVVLGIIFSYDRLISYGFMGAGVLLSVIDIIKNLKKK